MSDRVKANPGNPLLDIEQVLEVLRRRLPQCRERLLLDQADLLDVRHQGGGGECAVGLKLRFTERAGGGYLSQPVTIYRRTGDMMSADGLEERYRRVDERVLDAAFVELPELDAVLYPFPIDPYLPGLLEAFDRGYVRSALRTCLDSEVQSVKTRLMSYTIGARATLELRVRSADEERLVVGKLNASRPLAEMMANNWAVFETTHDRFGQSRPLGVVQSINMSLQSWIDGQRLNEFVEDREFGDYLEQIGRAAAVLHRQSLPLTKTRDVARETKSLKRRFDILREFHAEPDAIEDLEKRLNGGIERGLRITAPIHGDFHHANVLVADGRVQLIDFDEMGLGDPMLDVARFVVSLALPSLRVFGDLRLSDLAAERVLASYAETSPIDERRLAIFQTLACVTSAATTFRLQRPNWRDDMALLVEWARQQMDLAEAKPVKRQKQPVGPIDAAFWLAQPAYVSLTIKPYAWSSRQAEIGEVELQDIQNSNGKVTARYRLRLITEGERSSLSLRALARDRLQVRALQRPLDAARAASPLWLELPEIWGGVQPLDAMFYTVPLGKRMSDPAAWAPGAASRLASALAELENLEIECARSRSLTRSLEHLGLNEARMSCLGPMPDLRSPTLVGIDLGHLVDTGQRIGITRPDALIRAHPLLAVGRIAAEMATLDAATADGFRRAYLEATGRNADDLAKFEAIFRERACANLEC